MWGTCWSGVDLLTDQFVLPSVMLEWKGQEVSMFDIGLWADGGGWV